MASRKNSQILGVIPARYASSRFPGKPLHIINGKPLIQHVWERCLPCSGLDHVIIATDDKRILKAARSFGAEAELTKNAHPSGTDRIAEVARRHPRFSHIINVQGDEPLISRRLINRLAQTLSTREDLHMITAANVISDPKQLKNPNIVKVVLNNRREALYFSRSIIPFQRSKVPNLTFYRHQGIYGFSREFLLRFIRWKPTPLEQSELLEQLRALEHGTPIKVLISPDDSPGVDTPQQAKQISKLLKRS
ncbi:MAG: 3-deoxy-manno-octulosonate cytidylyltransferase [Verrucomicrobiota bacterium]